MSFKDILVHVDSTAASRVRLNLAVSLARRFGARLSGLHVIPEPDVPPYFKPSAVARIAKIYAENAREAADLAEALFREETEDAGVVTAWECLAADMAETIAERARFADLLMLGQFDTENPPAISAFLLPAKVAFGAATPILVIPNGVLSREIGRQILVAWDGSREAARAIRDAIPMLQDAERVSLLTIDPLRQRHMHDGPNPSELAAHLGRHGVSAETTELLAGEKSVTDALLAHAVEFGADLLVMGAYGHSRIWEFVVGGITQDLLETTTIPILMSR
jgi:nucleotide-binding universal stress UspA family protein